MAKRLRNDNKRLETVVSKTKTVLGKMRERAVDRVMASVFSRPEQALHSVYKRSPVSAERVLVNYGQGLVCLGKRYSSGLEWRLFPDRAVIRPAHAKIPKRLRSTLRKHHFELRRRQNFEAVIQACRRQNTWINNEAVALYTELFRRGKIDTFEAYRDGELVAGLWGLLVQGNFAIMSMFHRVDNAGSIVLGTAVKALQSGEFHLIDCGKMNDNFKRYGAVELPYEDFVRVVAESHFETRANDLRPPATLRALSR